MYEATGGFGATAHRSPQSPVTTKRRNPFGEVSPVYAKHGRIEPIDLDAVHRALRRHPRGAHSAGFWGLLTCRRSLSALFRSGTQKPAERTTQMLFNAQHLLSNGAMMVTDPEPSAQVGPCWTCRQTAQLNCCSFCSRSVCDGCVRQCAVCLDVFCTFCSSVRYVARPVLLRRNPSISGRADRRVAHFHPRAVNVPNSYEGSVDRNLCLSCLDEEMRRARELQRATANARRAAGVPATTGPAFAGAYLTPLAPFPII